VEISMESAGDEDVYDARDDQHDDGHASQHSSEGASTPSEVSGVGFGSKSTFFGVAQFGLTLLFFFLDSLVFVVSRSCEVVAGVGESPAETLCGGEGFSVGETATGQEPCVVAVAALPRGSAALDVFSGEKAVTLQ